MKRIDDLMEANDELVEAVNSAWLDYDSLVAGLKHFDMMKELKAKLNSPEFKYLRDILEKWDPDEEPLEPVIKNGPKNYEWFSDET